MRVTSEPRIQTYVALYYPDGIYSTRRVHTIDHRDPYKVPTNDNIFAIQFYDIIEVDVTKNETTVTCESKATNVSSFYYIRGKKLTLDEVKEEYAHRTSLIQNLERNEIDTILMFGDFVTEFDTKENPKYLKDYDAEAARNP